MIVPIAQSLRFRRQDSNYQNFDNTLLKDERFFNDTIDTYCQRWLTTDTVTVQIQSDSATLPTAVLTRSDNSTVNLTVTLKSQYDTDEDTVNDLFFFEFEIDMSVYTDESFVTVNQGSDTYVSEQFFGDADLLTELQNGAALEIQFFNLDNAFQLDFSTGITYKMYVESYMKDLEFGGEASVYDNQDELTKLKETVQRLMTLRTDYIPRYLGETLKLGSSMDEFVVNGVSYVRQDQPEITPLEGTNLVEYSMTLNDKEYLGVNTHDVGFDCDSPVSNGDIMVLVENNASGSVSFPIDGGYLIHTLKAEYVSGTPEIKLGTTVGGDDLVYPFDLASGKRITGIHGDESDSNYTVYATVTGGVANLTLQLIKNIQ